MGVVIFADQRLVRIFGLIADISIALFVGADAVCTNLILIAGLAGAAVNPTCRVVLGIGTLTRQRIQAIPGLALFGFTSCIPACARLPSRKGCAIDFRCAAFCSGIRDTFSILQMGIVLAGFGLAFTLHTNPFFCIFKGIAVDRAGRLTVGAGCGRISLTFGIVRQMVSDGARCNSAYSPLTNTGRGVFGRITVDT